MAGVGVESDFISGLCLGQMRHLSAFLEVVEIRRGAFLKEARPRGHVFEGHSLFLAFS